MVVMDRNGKDWAPWEDEIVVNKALTNSDIAYLVGRMEEAVSDRRRRLSGFIPRPGRKPQAIAAPTKKQMNVLKEWERICPVCGKVFELRSSEWVFKARGGPRGNNRRYLCSWGCMQKWRENQ